MSIFGKNSFDLIMNYYKKSPLEKSSKSALNTEIGQINPPKIQYTITSAKDAIEIYKKIFAEKIPKIDSTEEIHKYILETMKKEDEMDLNDKYIFSIYLAMNKHLINKEVIKDMIDEEVHLVLINWLDEEKLFVEDELYEKNKINTFNIFIGLLINIISLFEILPIKSNDLSEFKFYKKLFKINKFVKLNINLNINVSLYFLVDKIENLLTRWETQLDCLYLAKNIKLFNDAKRKFFLGKKKKRSKEEKDKEDTEADSGSERGETNNEINETKLGGLLAINKKILNKNKKVNFDLDRNQTIFFDKEKIVSNLLFTNF